jgi:hypothetical protein
VSFGSGPSLGAQAPEYNALRVQTSTQGMVIPVVFGTTRISGNLLWAGMFLSVPHQSGFAGGKGGLFGAGTSGNVEYTYSISFEIGLCEGPISGIGKCWRDKALFAIPPSDLTIFTGTYSQSAWSYLSSTLTLTETLKVPSSPYQITVQKASQFSTDVSVIKQAYNDSLGQAEYLNMVSASYPPTSENSYSVSDGVYTFTSFDEGKTVTITYAFGPNPLELLAYPGLAYIASPNFDLGKSDVLPNMTFEVQGLNIIGGGLIDANPEDIITAIITNAKFGLGISSSYLDLSDYSNWCLAANLLLSPNFNSQQNASDQIQRILDETFSTCIWHDCSSMKVVPYGDTAHTANGVTWTPDVTPSYDLTDDDFLGDNAKDPVRVTRKSPADLYNNLKIECLDRDHDYNPAIVEFMDQGSIDAYMLRQDSTKQMHDICQPSVASQLVQLMGQRALYIRNEYNFTLGWAYCLLEPMDIVTLTDSGLGLNDFPVRITRVEENDNGDLDITAEDFPQGVGHAATYPRQTSDGFTVDYNADPGSINVPVIFTAPASLAGQNEVWIAIGGGNPKWGGADVYISTDDSTYKFLQRVYGASRFGILSAPLPSQSDPDTTNTLSVDLTPSQGQILSGTEAEADNDVTLCIVGPGNSFSSPNLVTNGGFDSDVSGWYPGNCSLAPIAGGQSGNCLEMTRTGENLQYILQGIPTVVGKDYQFSAYVKSGTSGDQAFMMYADSAVPINLVTLDGISSGNWTKYSVVFTATTTTTNIYLRKDTATAGTMLFDTVSVNGDPGNELISYATATVSGTYKYDLTYLRRGQNGSMIGAHSIGEPFVRLDESVVRIPIDYVYAGSTFYLKFCSFNTWQAGIQSLADVDPYPVNIPVNATLPLLSGSDSYGQGGYVFHTKFDSLDNFQVDQYDGSITLSNGSLIIQTGTALYSVPQLYRPVNYSVLADCSFDKNKRFKTRIYFDTITNQEALIFIGSGFIGTYEPRHIGFKVMNAEIWGTVGDGTVESAIDTGIAYTAGSSHLLECIFIAGKSVAFYVDGILKGAVTSNLPIGTGGNVLNEIGLNLMTNETVLKKMRISEWVSYQDP